MTPGTTEQKPRILIVEDREDDALLLTRRLGTKYRVETAVDGRSALRSIEEEEPDLVMVDIRLPDIDGIDLIARIREAAPRTSVIAMTAFGSEEIARKVMRLGASDYVIKPVDLKRVSDLVRTALDKRRLELEKRDLERKLRKERDDLRNIVECSADAIVMTDPAGVITLFSPGAEALFRAKRTDAVGHSIAGFLARGDRDMRRIMHEVTSEGSLRNRETDFLCRDGSRIITLLSGSVLTDGEERTKGILLVIKDITRNINLEREIYESKTELESVFDSIVDPLAVVSPDYVVTRANMASAELTGQDIRKMIGMPCHRVLNGSDERCETCPVEETYRTRAGATAELRSDALDEIFVINSYPIFDIQGGLRGVIEHRKVITEQKRLEEERRRLEMELMEKHKLSSIGLLVQGVAHNLNTPLGVILGRSELLKSEIEETLPDDLPARLEESGDEVAREAAGKIREAREGTITCLDVILRQVENMSDIIGNMMFKSRQEQDSEKKKISLNQVLQEELTFLEADMYFKHEIEKRIELDPDIPYIDGVYSDFSQSLTNIIRNAIDAMYGMERKILTVTTRHDERAVYVTIHDTGEGIREEDIPRLFDPFFTTKEFGSKEGGPTGVGLGLHSCYQLLNPYGVKFDIRSRPGDTSFTVEIPIHPPEAAGD
jgi:PAS domain S-box-containing protein